ncbi:T-complex protein 11-like X-linked protein 2 [Ctenodactylus gundi]
MAGTHFLQGTLGVTKGGPPPFLCMLGLPESLLILRLPLWTSGVRIPPPNTPPAPGDLWVIAQQRRFLCAPDFSTSASTLPSIKALPGDRGRPASWPHTSMCSSKPSHQSSAVREDYQVTVPVSPLLCVEVLHPPPDIPPGAREHPSDLGPTTGRLSSACSSQPSHQSYVVPGNFQIKMLRKDNSVLQSDTSEAENGASKPEPQEQSPEHQTLACSDEDQTALCSDDHPPESQPEAPSVRGLTEQNISDISRLGHGKETVTKQRLSMEKKVLPSSSAVREFVEKIYNVFWDRMKEQLSKTPPDFSSVLESLQKIKETLLSLLLPRQQKLRHQIEKGLNMEILQREAQSGKLNIFSPAYCILNMMAILCAPVRDEAVKKLDAIMDPVQLLRDIYYVLCVMKKDMVNYTLQPANPYEQEESVKYERDKFQKRLEHTPDLLDSTRKWLIKAAKDLVTPSEIFCESPFSWSSHGSCSSSSSMEFSSPLRDTNISELPCLTLVLYQGYLNLLIWNRGQEEYPETLQMDKIHLQQMETRLNQLIILGSVLLLAGNFMGNVLFHSKKFRDKLKSRVSTVINQTHHSPNEIMASVIETVSQEIHKGLKNHGLPGLSKEITTSLKGQLQGIFDTENYTRSIIEQGIHLFLKSCVIHGIQESLLDFPPCLHSIDGELAEVGWKFVNMMSYNKQIFNPYYIAILQTTIKAAEEEEEVDII